MQCAPLLLILCLGLRTGTVVTSGQAQECALTFYMTGTQQDIVVFTAEEETRSDTTTTGNRLTCACATVEGLTPLQWLDESGMVLPRSNTRRLVDYRAAGRQTGSAVNLRINRDDFSCAEAGEYTCVVGNNSRAVLVTPIGVECGPANVTVTHSPTGPVSIGTDLTLQCSAEDPTGSGLTYQWLRKGTLISGEVSPTLMVTVMEPEEEGTYTCRVRNRVGQGEASVTVKVIVVTSRPPMVTSSTPVVTSSTPMVTSSTPMVTSMTPMVTSSTPMVTFSTPMVTSSTPMVTSSTPMVTSSTPMVTSSTPMVTSSTPVFTFSTSTVTSSTPVFSFSTSTVTSSTPMVTSRTPVFTFSTSMVTSSTAMVTSSTPMVTMVEPSSTPTEPLPAPGSVRLVNGTGPHEGRVEIFYNDTWGTVCDNNWSLKDGLVVCRQLGYPGVLRVYKGAHFGEGTGPILFDNLLCKGNEDNLTQCPNGDVNCDHSEDAGVTCARETVSSSSMVKEPTGSTSALPSPDFMLPSTQDVQATLTLVVPSTPVVTPSIPVITPSTSVIASSPSDVAPSTPVATSSTSVITPSTQVITLSKPVVIPSIPDITVAVADSATPEVTPSFATLSSSARPSTSPTPSPSVDPQTPMGMSVNHSTTDDEKVDITLMWSKPGNDSGLTGYQIQYNWESKWDPSRLVKRQSERKTMSVNVTATSYTLKDAEGFAEYCFAVSALYEGGEESNATDEECTTTPETKPSPPLHLRQVDSSVTTSSVRLQWDAPDRPNGNIKHFKVYYQQGSSQQYQVSDWQRQGYAVLDGLDPNTEYYINVTAVTDTLESEGSNGLRVVTLHVAALATPATGTPGWLIAVIVIVILLILIICIIVVAVVLCCVLAKRAGKYDVPAAEKTSKVNYVYEMEEEEGSKKEEVDEKSPVLVTAT